MDVFAAIFERTGSRCTMYFCALQQESVRRDSNFIPLICVGQSFLRENFFPFPLSPFFLVSFRLNYHLARKAAARVWRTNRAIIFLPEHFSKLLSGFVLSFVTRATVGPRPVYQLYRLAIPAPIHPFLPSSPRYIRSYTPRFFFSSIFVSGRGTIKVNDLYASFIRLTLKTRGESSEFKFPLAKRIHQKRYLFSKTRLRILSVYLTLLANQNIIK